MKPYQERLLKLAGFRPHEHIPDWYLIGIKEFMDTEETSHYALKWHSLDWLEEYIMPAVRGKYGISEECFFYENGLVWCDLIKHKGDWLESLAEQSGNTLAEALNNALEELVK